MALACVLVCLCVCGSFCVVARDAAHRAERDELGNGREELVGDRAADAAVSELDRVGDRALRARDAIRLVRAAIDQLAGRLRRARLGRDLGELVERRAHELRVDVDARHVVHDHADAQALAAVFAVGAARASVWRARGRRRVACENSGGGASRRRSGGRRLIRCDAERGAPQPFDAATDDRTMPRQSPPPRVLTAAPRTSRFASTWRSSEVLPAPRKPESSVTGTRVSSTSSTSGAATAASKASPAIVAEMESGRFDESDAAPPRRSIARVSEPRHGDDGTRTCHARAQTHAVKLKSVMRSIFTACAMTVR